MRGQYSPITVDEIFNYTLGMCLECKAVVKMADKDLHTQWHISSQTHREPPITSELQCVKCWAKIRQVDFGLHQNWHDQQYDEILELIRRETG